ncbi:phage tail tape measure protein [Clostridium botulinum]|uniref:phage tail tape measure protein n=1 Tax=Clostridium botulinum TaxID=1491 RepID=UPI000C767A47|nr:phage tail tape measure protein [Clostridium botulinum]AUM89164.1 phage tail tape measure protein [Clostridium botulinum]
MASNTEKRITAKMVLDSSGFNSSLKGVNSELRNAQSQMKLASSGIQAFGKNSEKLKSVQEALSKQVELHSKKVDIYSKSIEKTKTKLDENIKVRDKLKKSLDDANKKYEDAVKTYGKESEEAKKAKAEVDRLTQEHKKSEKAVESNAKKIQQYDTDLNKAQSQMNKAQGELKKINEELDKQNNKWLKASDKLKDHSEKLTKVGGKLTDVGKTLTTHVSLPLAAVGVASAKVGMDFEAEMSKVQAISGATGGDFQKLKAKAEEMGAKTKFSATESAQGLEYMAMAGWKTQDMLDGLPPILNLAIASGEELGSTSDIVTDALTAFGLKAKDAGMFSDVLAAASSNANTNVGMMGATFQYAAPVAGALGYSVQDTAIAIGLMANAGIKADKAGTAIRTGLTNLVKPTDAMATAMDKYGISVEDTNGKMKPFRQVIEELRGKLGNLDKATQANVVSTIFGKEAMSGWLSVINASPEDVNKLTNAIDTSKGATDKMAATMSNNAKGSITEMKSALEGAGIKIFEVVAPSITSLAKEVSKMADKFSKLNPSTQETIVKMAALGIAIGPVIGGVGKLITGFGSILSVGSKVTGIIGKITLATKGVEVATTTAGAAATSATGAASAGLAGLGSIALPVIGVIAAVGGAVYLAHKNTQYLNDSCVKSAEDMGTMETAMAGLNGHVIHTNKQLEEMNVKHKEWSNKVSKDTQKSLDQCANKIADYSLELKNAEKIDNLVDSEAGIRLKTKLDDICNSAIKKIKEKQPELQKTLADGFAADGKIDENEKKILASINKNGQEQIKKVNDIKSKILELEKKASKQTGETKKATLAEVDKLTKEIGNIELKNTVKSKEELMAAQADFNVRMKNLDMNGLSKLMESKAKARDTEVKKIKENYDKQIELLKLNSINVDSETKKAIDIKIGQLETAKNKEIGVENEKYKGYLDAAIEKYPQLINYIDMQHGTMLTKEQQQKQAELLEYGSKMEGFLGITETGYYKIKDSVTGQMHNCYVEVDKSTGQIVGAWDKSNNKIYGNPIKAQEKIDQELKNGQKFKPIGDSYDRVKEGIWKRAIEAQAKTNYNLFNWIHDAHSNAQSWLSNHPFIASVVQQVLHPNTPTYIPRRWTGDKYFTGGLTYLHDAPGKNNNYELYDLPRGSRIYNHDASEDLVIKTAENVASKVANSVLKNFKGLTVGGQNQTIIVPVNLDSREIARVTAKPMSEELGKLNRRGGLGYV